MAALTGTHEPTAPAEAVEQAEARRQTWRMAVLVTSAVVVVLALGVGLTGIWLARNYRPVAPGADRLLLSADVRQADTIRRLHEASLFLLLVASVGAVVAVIGARWRGAISGRQRLAMAGAVGTLLAALVTSYSWELVQWDQLALWAVSVEPGIGGLWFAAFDDQVRFILIGDVEVSQQTYAVWTVVHLTLPLAVIAAAAAASSSVLRRAAAADVIMPVE